MGRNLRALGSFLKWDETFKTFNKIIQLLSIDVNIGIKHQTMVRKVNLNPDDLLMLLLCTNI